MILNISGRTDIVAFYTPWLINRFKEGYVDVRNPFYQSNISRIYFKDVDLIIFCTKNPWPIIPYLKEIKIPIIFHITLTPYKKDIEPNVIDKKKIIAGIKKVSEILGKERVYVRYDPILLNSQYNLAYHQRAFTKLVEELKPYVFQYIISFIDNYKNVQNNQKYLNLEPITTTKMKEFGKMFKDIIAEKNIKIQTCYENIDLEEYGILKTPCISKELAFTITGKKFPKWSARKCNCVAMADIGEYNTCNHLCKYCYANYDEKKVKENILKHDVNSSLLLGTLQNDDVITIRKG